MSIYDYYPDALVKRMDIEDPEACVEAALERHFDTPYSARVIYTNGTYVDLIADSNSKLAYLLARAEDALLYAYHTGRFGAMDENDQNTDDEEEDRDDLSITDEPYSDSENEPKEKRERSSYPNTQTVLYYMETDAQILNPEWFVYHVGGSRIEFDLRDESIAGISIDETVETFDERRRREKRKKVNSVEECLRLARDCDLSDDDDGIRIIFSNGVYIPYSLASLTLFDYGRDFDVFDFYLDIDQKLKWNKRTALALTAIAMRDEEEMYQYRGGYEETLNVKNGYGDTRVVKFAHSATIEFWCSEEDWEYDNEIADGRIDDQSENDMIEILGLTSEKIEKIIDYFETKRQYQLAIDDGDEEA